jgi:hypothetical protein
MNPSVSLLHPLRLRNFAPRRVDRVQAGEFECDEILPPDPQRDKMRAGGCNSAIRPRFSLKIEGGAYSDPSTIQSED